LNLSKWNFVVFEDAWYAGFNDFFNRVLSVEDFQLTIVKPNFSLF